MSASTFKNSVSQERLGSARIGRIAASAVIFAALLTSLLGPGWLSVPANPAAKTPEMTLSFSDLHDLANSGAVPTTGIQQSYFGWLGWTLVLATGLTALLVAVVGRRALMTLLAVLSVAGLIVTMFAVKGALSWADFVDQVPNVRIGGYLVVIGYVAALAVAILLGIKTRGQRD